MAAWFVLGGVLVMAFAALALLMRYVIDKAARAELMVERLPLIAARRQSAALAMQAVWPALALSSVDMPDTDHPSG